MVSILTLHNDGDATSGEDDAVQQMSSRLLSPLAHPRDDCMWATDRGDLDGRAGVGPISSYPTHSFRTQPQSNSSFFRHCVLLLCRIWCFSCRELQTHPNRP